MFEAMNKRDEHDTPPPDDLLDGSVFEGVGPPPTVPERTPENFICLRGPCRYYWHLETMAQEGNPEGTFDRPLRQHHHTCLVNPGMETDFQDDNAYECNKWDPMTLTEISSIRARREDYLKRKGK